MLGACVLQETRPYRRSSDTEVAVAAQYCVFCWCFSIILRDMGISDRNTLIAMGVVLIASTVAVFAFALRRSVAEASALRLERQASNVDTTADEESRTDGSPDDGVGGNDDESTSPAPKHTGSSSPQDIAVVQQRDSTRTEPRSPWQLLGLCAAESESGDSPEGDTYNTDALVAKLRGELTKKDAILATKDAEIAKLRDGNAKQG